MLGSKLNSAVVDPIITFKNNYLADIESSRFKRFKLWFFPEAVKKALEVIPENSNEVNLNQLSICYSALFNNTSFLQRWLFSCFRRLFGEMFDPGVNRFDKRDAQILGKSACFEIIATHSHPHDMSRTISALVAENLFNTANQADLLKFNTAQLCSLSRLQSCGILNQENFDVVKRNPMPSIYDDAISISLILLKRTGLYTSTNRAAVLACSDLESLYGVMECLSGMSLFKWTGRAQGLLTQANLNKIVNHRNVSSLEPAIRQLWNSGYLRGELTQSNFDKTLALPNPQNLAYALAAIDYNHCNKASYDCLFQYSNILLTDAAGELWAGIPPRSLNNTFLNAIKGFCENKSASLETRQRNFAHYMRNEALGINTNNSRLTFNTSQSTHTASVHLSVSESATRLMTCYGSKINRSELNEVISNITTYINKLPNDDIRYKAAKACIPRITSTDNFFMDHRSRVSTKQLVALSWLALHDDTKRQGTLSDALEKFIQALYEIQRGYNLSDADVDDLQKDRPICLGGTFNKFIEKLVSIVPDAELRMITKTQASSKLLTVIAEKVTAYLKKHVSQMTTAERAAFESHLQREGNDLIWLSIKPSVLNSIFDDFGSLYQNDKANLELNSLVDCGKESEAFEQSIRSFFQTARHAPLSGSSGIFASIHSTIQAPIGEEIISPMI